MAVKQHQASGDDPVAGKAAAQAAESNERVAPVEGEPAADLAAISAEIDRIRASVANIAEATSHYVRRRVAENSTDLIAENPVRAALWAALAGFLVGRLTR